jgi:hypothetical protein
MVQPTSAFDKPLGAGTVFPDLKVIHMTSAFTLVTVSTSTDANWGQAGYL